MSLSNSKLLREQEVAERLGVSVRTIQHWRLVGGGPVFIKVGRCVRYAGEDLTEFMNEQRRRSTSECGNAGQTS